MCLLVKNRSLGHFDEFIKSNYLTAENDIVCYKALECLNVNGEEHYFTPYENVRVDDEVLEGKKEFNATLTEDEFIFGIKNNNRLCASEYEINNGVIHTMETMYPLITNFSFMNCDIFKCVIPKGTKYMKGEFNGEPAYGSRSIRIVKKI